jgi:ammonium transporter, Amt family
MTPLANLTAATLSTSVDLAWQLISGALVFYMQAGFVLLESGSVRAKNSTNILMKNILDFCIGAVGWWLIGFGIAYGEDNNEAYNEETKEGGGGFIGTDLFAINKSQGGGHAADWFFQFSFCATATTIVSGALAERAKMQG